MRVRHTLPLIALMSAMTLGTVGMTAVPAAAQDRGYQRGRETDYSSALRFNVSPNRAEVFIDGSYAGRVDDFDGMFQKLRVRPGQHEVVLYLDGYRTVRERVFVGADSTRTIQLNLPRLGRGERAYGRPVDRGTGDWWDPRSNNSNNSVNSSARLGTVSLGLAPYDSEVWVDGRRWSQTGNGRGRNERMALRLNAGRHRIEVRRPGYQTYVRELNVPTGGTVSFNVTLRRG
jgi:hypothetical protein